MFIGVANVCPLVQQDVCIPKNVFSILYRKPAFHNEASNDVFCNENSVL